MSCYTSRSGNRFAGLVRQIVRDSAPKSETMSMSTKLALVAPALLLAIASPSRAADEPMELAAKAQAVFKAHCYKCHGQDGAIEGGMNYIADLGKLVARKKVVPGDPAASAGSSSASTTAPCPRPTRSRDRPTQRSPSSRSGSRPAPRAPPAPRRARVISTSDVYNFVLADLETIDRRARRFQRYFTLAHLHNSGLSDEELQTYRNALNKLVNSLSWGSKIVNPVAIDPHKTVFRIDLRWYVWDATIWNRILQEYPYGILEDTTAARAATVGTLTKVPVVRADWFVATASRAPLYYDVLQLPASLTEVEKLVRVDAIQNIQQERVARLAFNGSGISRFNRILERHDSAHGMYWRTYDFDEPPANLGDRLNGNLVPDPRNVFAFPLGPAGLAEFPFQHAGGEAIFALPNGLHAYYLANANNSRLDKGPIAIVSDPKRPDRAVEAGVSCMSCHVTGILPKADQMRDHLAKNPKAFTRQEADLIKALYPGKDKVLKLMEDDAKKYAEMVAKTGAKVSKFEAVSTITLKYEADIDLETAAAEVGLRPSAASRQDRPIGHAPQALRLAPLRGRHGESANLGAGVRRRDARTAARHALPRRRSTARPTRTTPANSTRSNRATARRTRWRSSRTGQRAVIAAADRSVRLWDVEGRRDVKRFIGHTASVWAVSLSLDGKYAI